MVVLGFLRKELMVLLRVYRGEKWEWCLKRMEVFVISVKELRRVIMFSSEVLRLILYVFG